jgi:hypothetical protein
MRMSREQYVLLGPAGLMQHCEKIEAEKDRLTAYAEQFKATALAVVEAYNAHDGMLLSQRMRALLALAKNPNPSGHTSAEASELRKAPEASGPVGLGPAKFDSVFRAEAREVWTTITGNGPGLWNDYDLQSIDTLEKALQRAATLSQSKASDDHITKIAALGAIDAVHHELSRALSLNERAAELVRESLATHVQSKASE